MTDCRKDHECSKRGRQFETELKELRCHVKKKSRSIAVFSGTEPHGEGLGSDAWVTAENLKGAKENGGSTGEPEEMRGWGYAIKGKKKNIQRA